MRLSSPARTTPRAFASWSNFSASAVMNGSSEPAADSAKTVPAETGVDCRSFPSRGRLLGLDFGTRRIGIAVSDEEQRFASPLENYSRSQQEADARRLRAVAEEYRAA